jgi:hypothetical protein
MPPRDSPPSFIPPMMAKLTDKLPEGEQWTYEVKWDEYRALLWKSRERVRLLSRKDNDLTATYPTIEAAGTSRPRPRWSTARSSRSIRKESRRSRHFNIDPHTATTPSCFMRSICSTSMART